MSRFREPVDEDTTHNMRGQTTLNGTRSLSLRPRNSSCSHLSRCSSSHLSGQALCCTVSRSREHCHCRRGPHCLLRHGVGILPRRHVVTDGQQRLLLVLRPPLRCRHAASQRPQCVPEVPLGERLRRLTAVDVHHTADWRLLQGCTAAEGSVGLLHWTGRKHQSSGNGLKVLGCVTIDSMTGKDGPALSGELVLSMASCIGDPPDDSTRQSPG